MDHQQGFIEEVVRSGGVCERDQVMNLYQTNPDLERYSDWSASWKTRRFKDIAAGMGYQVNPGRTGNRWQQKVNGEMKDFYELIRPLQPDAPQTQEGSGGIQTNAEKAAAEGGVGNYLYVVVEPSKKGGGKSFYGEFRFPPGGRGKLIRVCIGPYGTAPGQWTLKAARDERTRIRAWSLETGKDPR